MEEHGHNVTAAIKADGTVLVIAVSYWSVIICMILQMPENTKILKILF